MYLWMQSTPSTTTTLQESSTNNWRHNVIYWKASYQTSWRRSQRLFQAYYLELKSSRDARSVGSREEIVRHSKSVHHYHLRDCTKDPKSGLKNPKDRQSRRGIQSKKNTHQSLVYYYRQTDVILMSRSWPKIDRRSQMSNLFRPLAMTLPIQLQTKMRCNHQYRWSYCFDVF